MAEGRAREAWDRTEATLAVWIGGKQARACNPFRARRTPNAKRDLQVMVKGLFGAGTFETGRI